MKVKTYAVKPPALDWLVAKALGMDIRISPPGHVFARAPGDGFDYFQPSTNPQQGMEISKREGITLTRLNDLYFPKGNEYGVFYEPLFEARIGSEPRETGPTPLIARMRCLVAAKLGQDVDVPDELIESAAPTATERERERCD